MSIDEKAKLQALRMAQAAGFMIHLDDEDQLAYVTRIIGVYEAAKASPTDGNVSKNSDKMDTFGGRVQGVNTLPGVDQPDGCTGLKCCPFCKEPVYVEYREQPRYEGDGWGNHVGKAYINHVSRKSSSCSGAIHTFVISATTKEEAVTKVTEAWNNSAPERESSERLTVMNTALGVILNYRDVIPHHIVQWAESKVDLSDAEIIEDEYEQGRRG